jgi:hypothetical protein
MVNTAKIKGGNAGSGERIVFLTSPGEDCADLAEVEEQSIDMITCATAV